MTASIAPMAPFDLIIFGGTGDLALRKLLPALFHRYVDGQIVAGARRSKERCFCSASRTRSR